MNCFKPQKSWRYVQLCILYFTKRTGNGSVIKGFDNWVVWVIQDGMYGMVWYDVVWCGVVWYGMVWV